MSEATDPTLALVREAQSNAGRRQRQAARLKAANKEQQAQLDELRAKLAKLETIASSDPKKDELIARLQTDLRATKHRSAFAAAAAGKIDPSAVDDAWQLLGWKPEADEPDAEKLAAAVDAFIESRPIFAAQAAQAPARDPVEKLPPGKGKGAPPANSFLVRETDFTSKSLDPAWRQEFYKAEAEGRVVMTP